MSITIKKNNALELDVPEFICDKSPIGEHLNKYDMLSHLNAYSNTFVIGKPGSGKTSLVTGFLKGKGKRKVFRKCFNHVLLVMPRSSRESMKDNIFKDHQEDKMFEELNLDSLNNIYNRLHTSTANNENTLLILDDVGAQLKNNELQRLMKQIIFNRRHLKVHIIMLLQSFSSCPREIRKLATNVFMFKPSKLEFEQLFEELFETAKKSAKDIMRVVYDRPHQYLMLNIESQRMYKGFDEIILKQGDDESSSEDEYSETEN
jgi:AAA+ ATPase superfamily predicted ATPase